MNPEADENSSEWTTVSKKPAKEKKKSSESPSSSRLEGTSKASTSSKSSPQVQAPRDPKAEAARRKAEREARFNTGRKVAAMPEILRDRGDASSGDEENVPESSSSRVDGSSHNQHKEDKKKLLEKSAADHSALMRDAMKDALKKLDLKAIEEETKSKTATEKNDGWIRLIPERLNEKLSSVPFDQSFYTDRGFVWGFPLNVAPKQLTDFFHNAFSSSPPKFLENYLRACLIDAFRSLNKPSPKPVYGSQLVIQYLLKSNPALLTDDLLNERIRETNSVLSRKDEMLLIMWACGQVGLTSFSQGLHAWYKLMFPLLNNRNYTHFILLYLEQLLKQHKNPDFGSDNAKKQEIFNNIFDAFYGVNTENFSKHSKAKINEVFDKFKEIYLKKTPKETANSTFPVIFMRLGLQQPLEYRNKACEILLECLKLDLSSCIDEWWTKYPTSSKETQVLLDYIADSKLDFVRKLQNNSKFGKFLQQIENFQPSKNKKSAMNKQDFILIHQSIKKIRNDQRREARRKLRKRFFWFFVLFAAAIVAEIMYHGTKDSRVVGAYKYSKPHLVRTWNTLQPMAIDTWHSTIKPFVIWLSAQVWKFTQIAAVALVKLWEVTKTQLPVVYEFLADMSSHLGHLWRGLATFSYEAWHKLDDMLVGFPSISEMYQKLDPALRFMKDRAYDLSSNLEPMIRELLSAVGFQAVSAADKVADKIPTKPAPAA